MELIKLNEGIPHMYICRSWAYMIVAHVGIPFEHIKRITAITFINVYKG